MNWVDLCEKRTMYAYMNNICIYIYVYIVFICNDHRSQPVYTPPPSNTFRGGDSQCMNTSGDWCVRGSWIYHRILVKRLMWGMHLTPLNLIHCQDWTVWRKYAYQGGGCQLGLQLFLSKCISTMGGVSWNMEKTVSSKSSECINTRGAGIIRYHDANVWVAWGSRGSPVIMQKR